MHLNYVLPCWPTLSILKDRHIGISMFCRRMAARCPNGSLFLEDYSTSPKKQLLASGSSLFWSGQYNYGHVSSWRVFHSYRRMARYFTQKSRAASPFHLQLLVYSQLQENCCHSCWLTPVSAYQYVFTDELTSILQGVKQGLKILSLNRLSTKEVCFSLFSASSSSVCLLSEQKLQLVHCYFFWE